MKNFHNNKFAIIWSNGNVCSGNPEIIAKHFLKANNLRLGIIRVNGQLFYSTKSNNSGSWQTHGSIFDTGNRENNRKAALAHYFFHFIINNQCGFHIIAL